MKTSPSLQKKSKFSTRVSFAITAVFYVIGLLVIFLNRDKIDKIDSLAQSGNMTMTMSLASINTHSAHLQHTEVAQVAPKQKPKPKPKPKPKRQEKPKPKPIEKPKPKPEPKPKPVEKPRPKPEPKPKEVIKKEEPAKEKEEPKQATKEPAHEKVTEAKTKEPPKEIKKKKEESNKTTEGAQANQLAYNQGVSDEFLMKVQMAISAKNRYPRMAMVRGIEGEVLVEFILNVDGSTTNIKISKSSGSDLLNHAALQAVKEASRHFPTPKQTVRLRIPIAYTLKE